ncbi:YcaO-like family protein [Pseudoalteromonas rubra]|uniref:YcaO-like family protein n=1 Tax=Pseudoalteromonas rubra TaxID=43658 RepID=UPI000F78B269|nr:YcaO-like family protein [Pseudoalteromonas rubra]
MSSIIMWNPKFNVIIDKLGNVYLTHYSQNYVLEHTRFPLFQFIDGKQTVNDIALKSKNPHDSALFYYYLDSLIKTELVIPLQEGREIWHQSSMSRVINVTENLDAEATDIPDSNIVITKDILELSLHNFQVGNKSVVIIEDFFNLLVISPPLESERDFEYYVKIRANNLPMNSYFITSSDSAKKRHYRQSSTFIDSVLTLVTSKQLLASNKVNVVNSNLEVETFSLNSSNQVKKQWSTKIVLRSCPITFGHDGGSRSIKPELTNRKIEPYINRCTGLINELSTLNDSGAIKIYRTAFFKHPAKSVPDLNVDEFNQTCLGKGVTHEQSKASALCEAIERKNAQYVGDELTQVAQAHQLDARSYNFSQLLPYSEQQYARFADPADSESQRKQAALSYTGEAVNWTALWSLTRDEKVYVPTVCCFANTPFEEDRFGKWHSNGCAAGNNLEEAILQALFELLERDATAIWWYNRLPRPQFELSGLDPDYLAPLHQTITAEHDYWMLDLTVDTGVPVMAAIGRNKVTQGYVFGFGCHLKPEMAAQRALTELCQLIPIRDQNGAPFDFDAITDDSFLQPEANASRASYQLTQSGDLKDDILVIVEQLNSLDMETLALDYSRSPIPLSTAKVFVPGLCHIWPQLGNPRLYETPVKLGWLDKALTEKTINQQGLYI